MEVAGRLAEVLKQFSEWGVEEGMEGCRKVKDSGNRRLKVSREFVKE